MLRVKVTKSLVGALEALGSGNYDVAVYPCDGDNSPHCKVILNNSGDRSQVVGRLPGAIPGKMLSWPSVLTSVPDPETVCELLSSEVSVA